MVTIVIPSVWTRGGRTDFEATEGPLLGVIAKFAAENPSYRHRLLGSGTTLLTWLSICVDDDLVPHRQRADTTVEAGSTITVMAPMAGG